MHHRGGGILRAIQNCFIQKQYCVAHCPSKSDCYSKRRFLRLFPVVPMLARPTAINDKNGERSTIVELLAVSLFPSLEYIFHRRIQSSLHTFLHHLQDKSFHRCFLFLFAFLFILFTLAHFITLTVLLKLRVGMTTSLSASCFALYAASCRSRYSRRIFLRVA